MRYVVDLHSHSGYAGGVGNISLETVAETMAKKGIHAFGVGDCLQPEWRGKLAGLLVEKEPGLYALANAAGPALAGARFVMQTEVIFTSAVDSGGRKGTHTILLFPNFAAVDDAIRLLQRWEVKVNMGRPFIKCENAADVAEKCDALRAIADSVMVIPAHVMTPQGVYGSDHPVDSLAEVFGEFAGRITTVETGLSADPELLALLPELDGKTFISNSDCHSGALNRVGREFTALEVEAPSYENIVAALRGRRVRYTAEFNPAEGRYFFTGHKAGLDRHGTAYCYFSPDQTPADNVCPICGKQLTVGVLERLLHLAKVQAGGNPPRRLGEVAPAQSSLALIPLVEVLAAGLKVKNASSRKVTALFEKVIALVGTESELWELPVGDIERVLAGSLPSGAVEAVMQVKAGDFSFQPGYDGCYGTLVLGRKISWSGQKNVQSE